MKFCGFLEIEEKTEKIKKTLDFTNVLGEDSRKPPAGKIYFI
jgi:hypothetical protein